MTGDPFYSTVTISNPAKRSGGNNEGEEIGKDYENKISSILVILATKETEGGVDKYKFRLQPTARPPPAPRRLPPRCRLCSKTKCPFRLCEGVWKGGSQGLHVRNLQSPLRKSAKNQWNERCRHRRHNRGDGERHGILDEIYDITGAGAASIWTNSNFLMTSVDMYERELPSEADLMKYNTPATPFPLPTTQRRTKRSRSRCFA